MSTSDSQNNDEPEGTARYGQRPSMLSLLLDQLAHQPGAMLAPKSIHQVVTDIVTAAKAQMAAQPGTAVYIEPAYDLKAAPLIFVMSELSNILGPSIKITPYQHPENHNHVVFQFKS